MFPRSFNEEMDRIVGRATAGMRQNYFVVIVAPKVPAPALTLRKCEDEETKSGEKEREVTNRRQGEARASCGRRQ